MNRADLLISGRVQGVFYRASAQQEAMRLGLSGEIRNLPDGRVEAVVEGPRERIEEFIGRVATETASLSVARMRSP